MDGPCGLYRMTNIEKVSETKSYSVDARSPKMNKTPLTKTKRTTTKRKFLDRNLQPKSLQSTTGGKNSRFSWLKKRNWRKRRERTRRQLSALLARFTTKTINFKGQ
jgi:hypothetical protein